MEMLTAVVVGWQTSLLMGFVCEGSDIIGGGDSESCSARVHCCCLNFG